MRRLRKRLLIFLSPAPVAAVVVTGTLWLSFNGAVRDHAGGEATASVRQSGKAERTPSDFAKRLGEYRKQIDLHASQEFWALVQADDAAKKTVFNRGQLEHVRRFGGPPLWEHRIREVERSAKEAEEGRKQAVEESQKRRVACPPKPGPALMGIVQLAESQGATHAKTTRDRTASPRFLRGIQADLDAGLNVNQACRKAGIAVTTYYRWKSLQENPISSEQLRTAELEAEVNRLKLLVAELALDRRMLQEALKKSHDLRTTPLDRRRST